MDGGPRAPQLKPHRFLAPSTRRVETIGLLSLPETPVYHLRHLPPIDERGGLRLSCVCLPSSQEQQTHLSDRALTPPRRPASMDKRVMNTRTVRTWKRAASILVLVVTLLAS